MPEAAESRHLQWLEYCAARIKTAGLNPIADTSIQVRKVPWNRNLTAPGVFVTIGGAANSSDTGIGGIIATNLTKVWRFPCQITIIRASNQNLALDDAWPRWRERAEAQFEPTNDAPTADGLPWVENILIEPGPALDSGSFERGYDVQAFIVAAIGRRQRGQAA